MCFNPGGGVYLLWYGIDIFTAKQTWLKRLAYLRAKRGVVTYRPKLKGRDFTNRKLKGEKVRKVTKIQMPEKAFSNTQTIVTNAVVISYIKAPKYSFRFVVVSSISQHVT